MGEGGRKRLGRGLDALISVEPRAGEGVVELPVDEIVPNRFQPRQDFDAESLEELAASIREHGVVQPIIVRRAGVNYEIVAGERRWRAARLAGRKSIAAVVRELSDGEAAMVALIENVQREDLNPIEEARAYRCLMEQFGLTQEEVALRVGKSRPAIANALRLLSLDETVQKWIAEGKLSAGHARALASLNSPAAQREVGRRVVEGGLNVRQTEALVRRRGKPSGEGKRGKVAETGLAQALAQELQRRLGTRVRILQTRGGKGRVEIEFSGKEELERVYDVIMGAS